MLMIIFGSSVLLSGTHGYLGQTTTQTSINGTQTNTTATTTTGTTSASTSGTPNGQKTTVTATVTTTATATTSTQTTAVTTTTTTTSTITTTSTTTSTSTTTASKPLLVATPSLGIVGTLVAISGSGLAPSTSYLLSLSTSNPNVGGSSVLATFTSTATGGVPTGLTVGLPDTPTTSETGTQMYLQVQTPALFGPGYPPAATAPFVLSASAALNMTGAAPGHAVVISAHGLNPAAVYRVIFNYVRIPFLPTNYTGTAVATITPNALGAGSATFAIPAAAPIGPTTIQLVVITQGETSPPGAVVETGILNSQPTIIVT